MPKKDLHCLCCKSHWEKIMQYFRSKELQKDSSEINWVKAFFQLIFKLLWEVYAKILDGHLKVDSKPVKEPYLFGFS
jgi:hypothetical protein